MPENQTVWKSDNQGVKEETFIQTGRRGGDRWVARVERTRGKVAAGGLGQARRLVEWQSHICVRINQEEQLGSKTDHETQCSSAEK